jgi:MATE family multidrug resistance protein
MNREAHLRVWRLAGPIIVSNISVPLLGAVDTAVMGHLPEPKHLGGVAVGAMIFSFLFWGFGFLRMGTGGLTAQAFGARDADEVRACLARAAVVGLPAAAALIVLQGPISLAAFALVEASDEVRDLARTYFEVRIWGAPATLLNFALLGWFIGVQNSRAALLHQLCLNGVNIALDLLFVVGFGWGVAGVAAATALADVAALAFGLMLAAPVLRKLGGGFVRDRIFDRGAIARTVSLNLDIFVRTICLISAFAYFTARGAAFGDVILAANAVLMNFQLLMAHALDGFAHAAEAIGGSAIGARSRRAFDEAVGTAGVWALGTAGAFSLVYLVAGPEIIDLLTGIETVRAAARDHLAWSVAMPLVGVFPYLLDGIFLGATRGREMRNAMVASLAAYGVACWVLVPVWGNHGLWAAMLIFMGARGVTLGVRYPALARSVGR